MGSQKKKIEAYLDCVSPTSYLAFSYLTRRKQALQDLGVDLEFIPVFLGGIQTSSGNKPPWTLPAKAAYFSHDTPRALKYFGLKFTIPDFFPILSLVPQRCLTYVKIAIPDKLEPLFEACFESMWVDHKDLSKAEHMLNALQRVFDSREAEEILRKAQSPEIKQNLNDATSHAAGSLGAFGCPWFWVHDGNGNAGPFFGSDRFHYMWDYLDLPHRDLELDLTVHGKL
ncbi:Glutathione S-transferase kappa [Fusarium keratoplasticum]|nr:Glutathione S-transferase kappa [Fusarium keratoplasticum]